MDDHPGYSLDGYREARPIRLTFADDGRSGEGPMKRVAIRTFCSVAIVAAFFATYRIGVREGARDERRAYIRYHEVLAGRFRDILDGTSPIFVSPEYAPKLREALRNLVGWHERRARELGGRASFSITEESLYDCHQSPTPGDREVVEQLNDLTTNY